MAKLVIVESPAKAKTIKKFLGSDFEVKASMGHVRDLYPSRLSVDVNKDFEPKYTVIKGKEKLVAELTSLVKKADDVYLATDPDREGEAISWHLATLLGLDINTVKRVKFNEINKKCVTTEIARPSVIDMDLVNAQQARRILDRLVGYTLSPFISQKIRRGLSAGRVQSVAVRLIVDREEEINAFVPEEFWTIEAKLSAPPSRKVFKAVFYGDETGKVDVKTAQQSQYYIDRLDGAVYTVDKIKKGTRKRQSQPPFTTSTMQQDASHRLGFTAQRTMRAAQELYEGVDVQGVGSVGLITYMRTDSRRISEESRAAGNKYIRDTYGEYYLPEKQRYFAAAAGAQDGHEAIRPTMPELTPARVKGSLTSDQFRLYELIWKRFIASLMAPCVQNTVKVDIRAAKPGETGTYCMFGVSGYSVKFPGYTVLYDDRSDDDTETDLPEMTEGQELRFKGLDGLQHFTQPPARYTEASLIKKMEETGIGRPSTYASIISTITSKEYVVREKKALKPTELGIVVTDLLRSKFPKIVNTKFTAGMETQLDEVEEGKLDYISMLHEFYDDYSETMEKAKDSMKGVKLELKSDVTDIPCDKCGRMMVVKVGRFGKFLACPGYPECKNTKPYIEKKDARCPICGGDVVSKKTKRGYTFYGCSNYPTCNFMTWDQPTDDKCPKCGSSLFKSRGGVVKCYHDGCDYEVKKGRGRKKTDENNDNES